MKNIILILILSAFCFSAHAQIFGRIIDRAQDKLMQKLEDRIVEEISEEIARQAFRPIDEAIQQEMQERYRDSLNNGQEVDWEKNGEAYQAFLLGMNKEVELPKSYEFDYIISMKTTDPKKKSVKMDMYLSRNGNAIGFENEEKKGESKMVVIDFDLNAMVMYEESKKGEKSVVVLPSFMNYASTYANANEGKFKTEFEKTGNTKTILGYKCEEYKIISESYEGSSWVADDFPVQWQDAFGKMMKQFSSAMNYDEIKGFVLYSESHPVEDSKKVSSAEVTKINDKGFKIDNSEYQLKKLGEN